MRERMSSESRKRRRGVTRSYSTSKHQTRSGVVGFGVYEEGMQDTLQARVYNNQVEIEQTQRQL